MSWSVSADALCGAWRTLGVGAVGCSSIGLGGYRAPRVVIQSVGWLSRARHSSPVRAWRGAKRGTVCRRWWHAGGDRIGCKAVAVIHLHAVSGTIASQFTVPMPLA